METLAGVLSGDERVIGMVSLVYLLSIKSSSDREEGPWKWKIIS